MRETLIALLLVVVLCPVAHAGEKASTLEAVEALAAHVEKEGASFDNTNDLYKAAKAALEDAPDPKAQARYDEIQAKVADVMRRNSMPGVAWIMGLFGAVLLWGGFGYCLRVARKSGGAAGNSAA